MWTLLVILCLAASINEGTARNPLHRKPVAPSNTNQTFEKTEAVDEEQLALPTKFLHDDSHVKRLFIEDQRGPDGKVERIRLDDDEDRPGIRAYGLPRKILDNSGIIERIPLTEADFEDGSRSARLMEAYGMPKARLANNGHIERVIPSAAIRNEAWRGVGGRATRSIEHQSKKQVQEQSEKPQEELEDLEAQDAKVFRPLFVYRQQVAERQRKNRAKNHGYNHYHSGHYKPCNDRKYGY